MKTSLQVPLQEKQSHRSDAVQRRPDRQSVAHAAIADNRPAAVAQRRLQEIGNHSASVAQKKAQIDAIHHSPQMLAQRRQQEALFGGAVQRHDAGTALQAKAAKSNHTGLPNQLKSGIESMSGMTMDHVKVHYNSPQPAQLNAHAYAQGSDIHLAPGQEKHLPHEAWHVVQQAKGRVKATMQMHGGVPVNNDRTLEHEADVMGARAVQMKSEELGITAPYAHASPTTEIKQFSGFVRGAFNKVWHAPKFNQFYNPFMQFLYGKRQVVRGMEFPELERIAKTGTIESKAMKEVREATERKKPQRKLGYWGKRGRNMHLKNSYQPSSQYVSTIERNQYDEKGNHFGTHQVPLEVVNRGHDMHGVEPQVLVEGGTQVLNMEEIRKLYRAKLKAMKNRRTGTEFE